MKTFILIDSRSGNINVSFNHYYQTFAIEIYFHLDTLKVAPTFYSKVHSDLDTSCIIGSILTPIYPLKMANIKKKEKISYQAI